MPRSHTLFVLALAFMPLAFMPLPAAAQSNQGWVFTTTTTTDSAKGDTPKTMVIQMELLGPKYRIGMTGNSFPNAMGGIYMIVDSTAGTMMTIMPAQSMAMIMDTAMLAMAKPTYTMSDVGTPNLKTEDLGAGEPVLGHPTHHFRTTSVTEMKYTFGDESCSKKSKIVAELWTTNEPDVPDLEDVMKRMARNSGPGAPDDAAAKIQALARGKVQGKLLMQTMTTSVPTAKGDSVTSHMRMQINEMKRREIDPADFEAPAGYHTMDMREMMKGMDPSMLSDAMAATNASMKKSMCG